MDRPLILVADDDATLRQVYVLKLSKAGFTVKAAADGGELLHLVAEQTPALVLCDVRMVPLDGFDVLKNLPRNKRDFPIIMLTNFQDEETRTKADALGANGYLVKKDLTLSALVATVQELVKRNKKA